MYIERKVELSGGEARIGRVTFSKSGSSLTYNGKTFASLKGAGYKRNYVEDESGEEYWISGPKKRGGGTGSTVSGSQYILMMM